MMNENENPRCDGHEYENAYEYDLTQPPDYQAFSGKIRILANWFDDAETVYADEQDGHRHFDDGQITVQYNVEELGHGHKKIYWTVEDTEE